MWSKGVRRCWHRSLLTKTNSDFTMQWPYSRRIALQSLQQHCCSTWPLLVSSSYRWGKSPLPGEWGYSLTRHHYLISPLIRVWPKIKDFSLNLAVIFYFTLKTLSKVKFKELNSLEKDSLIVREKLVHSQDGCVETPVAFSLIVFVNYRWIVLTQALTMTVLYGLFQVPFVNFMILSYRMGGMLCF